MELTLMVNGRTYDIDVPPRKTLADALREDCGLVGAHVGCEQGVCGSCTVLWNGDAVRSCLVFAVQCTGAEITTVEGLADPDGALHPVQAAFLRTDAFQCGFCTPGFLMLLAGNLRGERVQDGELRDVVASNLCRCTGYLPILAAAREAADALAERSADES